MQLDSSLQSRVYFIPLAQYLSEEYKLIALDTRKHGRSGIGVAPDPIDNCKMILPKNDPTRQVYQTITLKKWREMFGKKISTYNTKNLEQYFGKLFNTASHLHKNIQCPLLVVHNKDDILLSRQQVFELTKQVNGARLLNLPFVKHILLQDMLERVTA